MKLQCRFSDRVPQFVEDVERFKITIPDLDGDVTFEICQAGGGVFLRLNEPISDTLALLPVASNGVQIHARKKL